MTLPRPQQCPFWESHHSNFFDLRSLRQGHHGFSMGQVTNFCINWPKVTMGLHKFTDCQFSTCLQLIGVPRGPFDFFLDIRNMYFSLKHTLWILNQKRCGRHMRIFKTRVTFAMRRCYMHLNRSKHINCGTLFRWGVFCPQSQRITWATCLCQTAMSIL